MKKLERILRKAKIFPKSDLEANWLRVQRPTIALLLCLCSGPWVFQRRYKLQKQVLEKLGSKDLSDFKFKFPLEWQNRYFANAKRALRHSGYSSFDEWFKFNAKTKESVRMDIFQRFLFLGFAGPDFNAVPKVIGMFARDYCCVDCFPQDRHVKQLLKDLNLPKKEHEILELFKESNLSPREYARGFFNSKSSNPTHEATTKDWMKIRK